MIRGILLLLVEDTVYSTEGIHVKTVVTRNKELWMEKEEIRWRKAK